MTFFKIFVFVVLSICYWVCALKSKSREDPDLDIVVVLGSTIVNASGSIVPAFHTEVRAIAAGVKWRRSLQYGKPLNFIVSGGYNVGVRYDLNGNAFATANYSFSAFALARNLLGPSEALVIRDYMSQRERIPQERMVLEETSASTEENGRVCAVILSRRYGFVPEGRIIKVGILTNLFHIARATTWFRTLLPSDVFSIQMVIAEDWIALDLSDDWPSRMEQYYSTPKGGYLWPASEIGKIMRARRSGDLSHSLAELIPPQEFQLDTDVNNDSNYPFRK